MDDSLEALLEKATNPKNTYEDWEFIMAFCDRVNGDLQGPQTALRIIVPKMRSDNDKVALLALTLLEACVKNCGLKFHQELGKFKFLNELIRMISPKYLGDTISPAVKEKIAALLYSWKVGLPQETKVGEAYLMLKREGLIFDESAGADSTLEPEQVKPKVALIEDPKQSQMLQRLLASRNPEDLRAANRLIRDMVRRDEKRMQKLQKRLEDVELIQNNVKLLNELLSHLKEDSAEVEKQLINELYKSIEKMRPNLFRMASELKQNEEGMSDILHTNDRILQVMDLYNSKMKQSPSLEATPTASNGVSDIAAASSTSDATLEATVGSAATAEDPVSGAALIDLADWSFDPNPICGSVGSDGAQRDSNSGLSSLMDDLSALDLGGPTSSNQGMLFATPPSDTLGISGMPPAPSLLSPGGGIQTSLTSTPPEPLWGSTLVPAPLINTSSLPVAVNFEPILCSSSSQLPSSGVQQPLVTIPPPPQHQAGLGMGQIHSQGLSNSPGSVMGTGLRGMGFVAEVPAVTNNRLGMGCQPLQLTTPTMSSPQQQVHADPSACLDGVFVPLESIMPGTVPAMSLMSKDNVSVTFHFAKNVPASSISVVVISAISTSPTATTNFQFQAAVPKVMRVKLQPPSSMELGAYNPILPPPSISQVMLLANPSKAKVRLKFRISYSQGGTEVVEMGEAPNFPEAS